MGKPVMENAKPDDDCGEPGCPGWLVVYRSVPLANSMVRYLHCWKCGCGPETKKHTIPIEESRRRQRKRNYYT